MIYIYGHSSSDHPGEFKDKDRALRYFTERLPYRNKFRYRTTYNRKAVERIIFSFDGELLAELIVDRVETPSADDRQQFDKVRQTCLIKEIRIFNKKTFHPKDFGLHPNRFGIEVPEGIYHRIIEAVGGYERIIKQGAPRINAAQFQACYRAFVQYVEQQNEEKFVSFSHPYTAEQESYKYDLHDEAVKQLGYGQWQESAIGSGVIIDRVIAAVELEDNNLVQHDLRYGESGRQHRSLLEARQDRDQTRRYETLLFNFYHNRIDDETAFNEFIELAGRTYAFIAYLYFLKDRRRYLPIAPTTFDAAFEMLGVDFKTSHHCSWDNYLTYNRLIAQVRDFLSEQLEAEVSLLDAHSFLWIIAYKKPLPVITVSPTPQPITPVAASQSQHRSADPLIIDYDERNRRLSAIGRLAEDIVVNSEKTRLTQADRADLAKQVQRVSDDSSLGYDILSFDTQGQEIQIEVKAIKTAGQIKTFYLTENEREKSRQFANYHLYLVTGVSSDQPQIFVIPQPDFDNTQQFNLEVVCYRVAIEIEQQGR